MKYIMAICCALFVSAFAKAQLLQSYIAEAEANNPQIKSFELRHDIAREKINEVNALPNTLFSAGYFVSEPETRTGAQRARFSVSQMLPWFGTITARENYASTMSEAEFVEVAIAKRQLALSVAQSYYTLYSLKARQKVLDENIILLRTYEQLALTSLEVGKASAVDILRLQIRQNELLQQKKVLQEDLEAEQVTFNILLNKKESMAIEIVPEMEIPSEEPILSTKALALHPELIKYDKLYESITKSELLNQKERAPNIGFGLDYVPVSERPEMNFKDNGKDILMPMLSVSIPIFNNKYHSATKQNELRQLEITTQKNQRINVLETAFAQAVARRNQARITYNTQQTNLKQASDAEEILIKNYETGTIDFNDVLDIQELQLKFGLIRINAIEMYYRQMAIINYLIK